MRPAGCLELLECVVQCVTDRPASSIHSPQVLDRHGTSRAEQDGVVVDFGN